jgi:predicted phosphodiesterase
MSDLHLEFYHGNLPPIPEKVGDVLVLAGDIHLGDNAIPWMEQCCEKFDKVFYILGNHEFYGNKTWKLPNRIRDSINGLDKEGHKLFDPIKNLHFLDNDTYKYKGVNFIGTTLWSNADPMLAYVMSDFKKITHKYAGNYGKFTPGAAAELFMKNMNFLLDSITVDSKNVVITHHAPSMASSATERYAHEPDYVHTGYATDILEHFDAKDISVWIHGHTHQCADYVENGIHVVANTFGYVNYEEAPGFSWTKCVEV